MHHFNTTYGNIGGWQHVTVLGHPIALCCHMLGVANRTSVHALVQHCCANLAKQYNMQHWQMLHEKFWPFSSLSQQHLTCCDTLLLGGQTHIACCTQQYCDVLYWDVVIVWPGLERREMILRDGVIWNILVREFN